MRPGIEQAGLSDIGCVRSHNEDRYSYWEPVEDAQFQQKGRLAIIADGMGGHEGGQEASRIAVETIEKAYGASSSATPTQALNAAFQEAHQEILRFGREHPALQGLGTTCTAAAVVGKTLFYAHIGDSRLYLLRDSAMQRLTHDHSYVGRLVEDGVIPESEAAVHPQRNILLKALGVGGQVAPESPRQPLPLQAGDVLLLCSDGLWSMVDEDDMRTAIAATHLSDACARLVEKAKERGGPDNITLQMLRLSK